MCLNATPKNLLERVILPWGVILHFAHDDKGRLVLPIKLQAQYFSNPLQTIPSHHPNNVGNPSQHPPNQPKSTPRFRPKTPLTYQRNAKPRTLRLSKPARHAMYYPGLPATANKVVGP